MRCRQRSNDNAPRTNCRRASCGFPCGAPKSQTLLRTCASIAESSERLADEATTILGKCLPPRGTADQRPAWFSDTCRAAKQCRSPQSPRWLATTAIPMVIVITGISNPLLDQSTRRLEQDLRLQENRKWRLFRNPKPADRQSIADVLADWRDERLPEHRRKTVLITVLKKPRTSQPQPRS